jgi:hypothetical protein
MNNPNNPKCLNAHLVGLFSPFTCKIITHLWVDPAYFYAARVNQNPTNAPWRMDGKWSEFNFPLGSNSLANHGG